jgi:hypothetical protein
MDARAFTLGTDIAFDRDARARGGDALMAHELAHAAEGEGAVRRTVAPSSHCNVHPAGMTDQEAMTLVAEIDALAQQRCDEAATLLDQEAQRVLDCSVGVPYHAYARWFGVPQEEPGGGFESRFGGHFATQTAAVAAELQGLAGRFRDLADRFTRGVVYGCWDRMAPPLPHCRDIDCGTNRAMACRGTSVMAICPNFFNNPEPDVLMGTFVHEMTHMFFRWRHRDNNILGERVRAPNCFGNFIRELNGAVPILNGICPPETATPPQTTHLLPLMVFDCQVARQQAQGGGATQDGAP